LFTPEIQVLKIVSALIKCLQMKRIKDCLSYKKKKKKEKKEGGGESVFLSYLIIHTAMWILSPLVAGGLWTPGFYFRCSIKPGLRAGGQAIAQPFARLVADMLDKAGWCQGGKARTPFLDVLSGLVSCLCWHVLSLQKLLLFFIILKEGKIM